MIMEVKNKEYNENNDTINSQVHYSELGNIRWWSRGGLILEWYSLETLVGLGLYILVSGKRFIQDNCISSRLFFLTPCFIINNYICNTDFTINIGVDISTAINVLIYIPNCRVWNYILNSQSNLDIFLYLTYVWFMQLKKIVRQGINIVIILPQSRIFFEFFELEQFDSFNFQKFPQLERRKGIIYLTCMDHPVVTLICISNFLLIITVFLIFLSP